MNDSFLEDLELVSTDVKNVSYSVDRHITTRTAASSTVQHFSPIKNGNLFQNTEMQSGTKELHAKDLKKLSEQDTRKHQMKVRLSERREKSAESKLKPIENKVKTGDKEHEVKDDIKTKMREARVKICDSKVATKDRTRRSGNYKENNQTSDVCIKENNRLSDCLREGSFQMEACKDRRRTCECTKKSDSKEAEYASLLNDMKDIVYTYTKQESAKILMAMQELHFNTQANLMQQLFEQTNDIISQIHPSNDPNRIKSLIEQNERLKEDIIILQKRNEDLQKRLEEFEVLKQENISLKLKCKELSK